MNFDNPLCQQKNPHYVVDVTGHFCHILVLLCLFLCCHTGIINDDDDDDCVPFVGYLAFSGSVHGLVSNTLLNFCLLFR